MKQLMNIGWTIGEEILFITTVTYKSGTVKKVRNT